MAYLAFLPQLVLNTLWSIIFFGAHNLGLALAEIVILWLAIIWTITSFSKISPSGGLFTHPLSSLGDFRRHLKLCHLAPKLISPKSN